jgi:hypothetical protein
VAAIVTGISFFLSSNISMFSEKHVNLDFLQYIFVEAEFLVGDTEAFSQCSLEDVANHDDQILSDCSQLDDQILSACSLNSGFPFSNNLHITLKSVYFI